MALSIFDDEKHPPGPAKLAAALGRSSVHWDSLVAAVSKEHAPIESIWKFAGEKFGWSLRLLRGERVILYLTPQEGQFLAGLALGRKAEAAARESGLTAAATAVLDAAPKYAEGRGLRMPVRSKADVTAVRKLVAAKVEN